MSYSFASGPFHEISDGTHDNPSKHCVRSNSKVVGRESNPQLQKSFLLLTLVDSMEDILVRELSIWPSNHLLHFGLSIIERKRKERTKESGNRSCHNSNFECFFLKLIMNHKSFFDLIERSKHTEVKNHGPNYSRSCSSPKSSHSFFLDDSSESIEEVFVISSLFFWKGLICLEPYQN